MAETPFKLSTRQAVRITVEFLVFGILVYGGVVSASELGHRLAGVPDVSENIWELIAMPLACIWVIWRAQRRHRVSWSKLAVWRVEPAGLFAPFLLAIVGTGIVLSGADNVMEAHLPSPDWLRELMREVLDLAAHPLTSFAAVVVVAPLTEEAIFRGVVLRGLLGEVRPWRAIAISSVLFAVMHMNPWQMPSAFCGGLILGWAYLRTRSLGLCVAGHALINAIGLFAPSLPFEIPGFNALLLPGQAVQFQPWWLNLGGVALLVIGGVWFHRAAPPAKPFPAPTASDIPVSSDLATSVSSLS